MPGKRSLSRPRSLAQRAAWIFAASALTLTLALGGCRAGAGQSRQGGGQPIQQTQGGSSSATGATTNGSTGGSTGGATGSSTSSNSSSLQQLQSIDNQNQSDSQQLNSAQNNAGVNYSSQENQTQP